MKGFSAVTSDKSQLGLSHSYSRAKVKFNVNKSDNMIIQSIALLDQLDKDINTFCMRIREWYSYHFPELIKIVPENALYAKVVKLIKNRKEIKQDMLDQLEAILMDSARAQAVIDASKMSMGMDISPIDLLNIEMFASRVIGLTDYRKELSAYLGSKMSLVAPNLSTLIGDTVGARLISHAGSLTNLAKAPASTVQILGAEKALFRALKTRGNTPKYGLIFHSSFIGRAGNKNKGRISRYLANKCSIASRIDAFSEEATTVFGSKLKEQVCSTIYGNLILKRIFCNKVEDRLKFYETGDLPRKNVEVMAEAVEEAADDIKKRRKKEKKKRKASAAAAGSDSLDPTAVAETPLAIEEVTAEGEPSKKKKKNKNKVEEEAETPVRDKVDTEIPTVDVAAQSEDISKKKKKKNKENDEPQVLPTDIMETADESAKKKKKRKAKDEPTEHANGDVSLEEVVPVLNGKKKKKKAVVE